MASAGPFVIMASMKKSCRATFCSGTPRVVTRTGAVAREATSMAPGTAASIAAPYALIEKDQSGHSASAPPNVEGRSYVRIDFLKVVKIGFLEVVARQLCTDSFICRFRYGCLHAGDHVCIQMPHMRTRCCVFAQTFRNWFLQRDTV